MCAWRSDVPLFYAIWIFKCYVKYVAVPRKLKCPLLKETRRASRIKTYKQHSSVILCVDCCIIQTKLERLLHANVCCAPPAVTYRGDLNSNVNAEQAQQNTAEFVQHRTHPSSCPLLVTESEDSYPAGNSNITFEQSPHAAQVGQWVQNCLSAETETEEVRTTQTLGVIQYVRAAVHWTTCFFFSCSLLCCRMTDLQMISILDYNKKLWQVFLSYMACPCTVFDVFYPQLSLTYQM